MELLQIRDEVVYPLSVEELGRGQRVFRVMMHAKYLADDVAGLDVTDSLDVLRHRAIVIALVVKVVAVLFVNVCDVRLIQLLRVCDVQREEVQPLPVQHVELR